MVEIRIYLDQIQIINFPGPKYYIDMEKFTTGKVRARRYRNPKIGEKDYDKVSAVIAYIEEHESFTLREAEKITKKSSATVYRHFKMLVGTKCVVTEGNNNHTGCK